jgi:hypothetical protein
LADCLGLNGLWHAWLSAASCHRRTVVQARWHRPRYRWCWRSRALPGCGSPVLALHRNGLGLSRIGGARLHLRRQDALRQQRHGANGARRGRHDRLRRSANRPGGVRNFHWRQGTGREAVVVVCACRRVGHSCWNVLPIRVIAAVQWTRRHRRSGPRRHRHRWPWP